MRSFSDGTAGGYSRGGLWKVSASCAVTWYHGVFTPRCPLASGRVPVIATSITEPREAAPDANIAVTPEQLQATAGQLNSGAANIESILSQLASQVAPLQTEHGIAASFGRSMIDSAESVI
jgi:hypothetical protein